MPKLERVRDPVHDLIEFGAGKFESQCWQLLKTRAFQRLRRIKQLGFSEFVYPGATHTRLSHSLGAFHTARRLAGVVEARLGDPFSTERAHAAVAAALVHDIGHGPFSHAFETALGSLGIGRRHELWTVRIILETEVRGILEGFKPGFADQVSKIVGSETPADIYASIVSSQFDADRLDYMRRDRLMTGTQQGGIDFSWLLANLEVGEIDVGQDGEHIRKAQTFVLGPKSIMAAEGYVLGLFQLYPTVYLHKATRGAEKIFGALLVSVIRAIRNGDVARTGLPANHPMVRFAQAPEDLNAYLGLDDTVIWGSFPLLEASDLPVVAGLASRLLNRKFYKCVDVTHKAKVWAKGKFPNEDQASLERRAGLAREGEARIRDLVIERNLLAFENDEPEILADLAERSAYKQIQSDDGALNRIWVRGDDGALHDLGDVSNVVKALVPFSSYRLYYRGDSGKELIGQLAGEVFQ